MKRSLAACAIATALVAGFASAEETGITVSSTAEVKAKPSSLEIDLQASGSAELTADALVKYRDSLGRVTEAFKSLKQDALTVESRALSIQNNAGGGNANINMVINGGAQAPVKSQIDINRALRLKVDGVDKMDEEQLTELIGKLLDTAKDAGANVTPGGSDGSAALLMRIYGQQMSSSVVTYVVDDAAKHRQEASRQAFEKAKADAERLAGLAGVKLGSVISLEETVAGSDSPGSMQGRIMAAVYGLGDIGGKSDQRVTSDKFDEIPISVTLRVRFAIEERKAGR